MFPGSTGLEIGSAWRAQGPLLGEVFQLLWGAGVSAIQWWCGERQGLVFAISLTRLSTAHTGMSLQGIWVCLPGNQGLFSLSNCLLYSLMRSLHVKPHGCRILQAHQPTVIWIPSIEPVFLIGTHLIGLQGWCHPPHHPLVLTSALCHLV